MDASTRLYKRLGEIPEDPNDPESLDDLIVCAFGAFERYYVCWKTKGGEFRQDGHELPPALKDWLYPTNGTTRDFASLQVVFGRGEEYFASDKNGKLEYKEPELKKPAPTEDEEKLDRQALRRSRTVPRAGVDEDDISSTSREHTIATIITVRPEPRTHDITTESSTSIKTHFRNSLMHMQLPRYTKPLTDPAKTHLHYHRNTDITSPYSSSQRKPIFILLAITSELHCHTSRAFLLHRRRLRYTTRFHGAHVDVL
ncbi:uncharacterized protein J4E87_008947 [Alternaria ethzedia]|uniref:uncharacterized protein n=1 Tax=Alternaria ethzedia TaxID=181014 RepID=UPI0020C22CB2|nr:uncharacterized protein J4E87_008947 [Alternaria ethzedia]KAI4616212.1 hypothetical protein J4E87_008947 [Alternaria ethzedia]